MDGFYYFHNLKPERFYEEKGVNGSIANDTQLFFGGNIYKLNRDRD